MSRSEVGDAAPDAEAEADRIASDNPRVSIIIDNYNYATFLPQAIDSALAQSWPNLEVIVVDDGSTDDSRSIIASYGTGVVAVLQDNAGQAAALNAGFVHSDGDLVIFLDADDRLHTEAAARVADAWRRQPGAGKFQYFMAELNGEGRQTGARKPPSYVKLLSGDLRRAYLTYPDDVWRLPTSGNAFTAAVLRSIGPIPEVEYRAGADTFLAHVAPLYGPVVTIGSVLADYRVHGGNRYELDRPQLNLDRIRRNVSHITITNRYLAEHAARLGLAPTAGGIGSVSYFVNRAISLKLDRARHPMSRDRPSRLVRQGARAALRRNDVSWLMRGMYIAWFTAFTIAPRPLAERLARWMVFPQTRGSLNGIIGRMWHPGRGTTSS